MDELELQTREALDGRPITQNIFPFQVPACAREGLRWAPPDPACMPAAEPGPGATGSSHGRLGIQPMPRR
jgi:hypothetical protein